MVVDSDESTSGAESGGIRRRPRNARGLRLRKAQREERAQEQANVRSTKVRQCQAPRRAARCHAVLCCMLGHARTSAAGQKPSNF
jgi:hypothetical protein